MKRFMVVALVLLMLSVTAHAGFIRQTVTYWCQGYYTNVYTCVGYVYNAYDDWNYPVYRWVQVWVPAHWQTDVRYVYVPGPCN